MLCLLGGLLFKALPGRLLLGGLLPAFSLLLGGLFLTLLALLGGLLADEIELALVGRLAALPVSLLIDLPNSPTKTNQHRNE